MQALAHTLNSLSRNLDRLALWGAVIAVAIMLNAAAWQVIARYLLAQPPVWTEELARFSMVWGGLLGATCAFRAKSDPSLFPEMRNFTGRGGGMLALVRAAGAIVFIFPILWYSIFGPGGDPARGYIARLAGRTAETMPVPMTVFGLAVPIAAALILLHVLSDLLNGQSVTEDDWANLKSEGTGLRHGGDRFGAETDERQHDRSHCVPGHGNELLCTDPHRQNVV